MYKPDIGITPEDRVAQFAPLVKRIAYHFMTRVPASVEVNDLIQVGMMGLMEAAYNYDASHGAQFETYATQRIRGAMLDELRDADWMPRSSRKNLRTIEASIHRLEHELGRSPNEQEIANALNLPLAEYQQMLDDARGYQLIYYEDYEEEVTTSKRVVSIEDLEHMIEDAIRNEEYEIAAEIRDKIEKLKKEGK